jgi:hypothetical protein
MAMALMVNNAVARRLRRDLKARRSVFMRD